MDTRGVRARHEITRGRLVADERHLPEQLKSGQLLSFTQTMTTALGRPAVLNRQQGELEARPQDELAESGPAQADALEVYAAFDYLCMA